MTMKSSALILAVLATCAGSTLLTFNGVPGDSCTRQFVQNPAAAATGGLRQPVTDWDRFTGAAGQTRVTDCRKNPTPGLGALLPAQRFPDSAITLYGNNVAAATVTVNVVECNLDFVPATPNTCAQVANFNRFFLAPLGDNCDTATFNAANVLPNAGATITIPIAGAAIGTDAAGVDSDNSPRKLCYNNPAGVNFWTGFVIAWNFVCDSNATCQTRYGSDATLPAAQQGRTFCCAPATGANGVCINPNVQSCCGGRPIETALEKCCNTVAQAGGVTRYQWQQCPCSATMSCPAAEATCCQRSKFGFANANALGTCYSNTSVMRCCNDGGVYNSGTHQCCSINGVQALGVPCPCGKNEDCLGGQPATQQNRNMACCMQRFPSTPKNQPQCSAFTNYQTTTVLSIDNLPTLGANPLAAPFPALAAANGLDQGDIRVSSAFRSVRDFEITQRSADEGYAPGRALPQFQRCLGQCINTTFEICCNGARCYGQYERCCNQTCCNKYLSSCLEHNRGPTRGTVGNPNGFKETFAECTTVESMNALRAFWVYVVPTFLLVGSLTGFAIVVLFVINTTSRAYSLTEKGLLVVSVAALLLSLPTFFSPIYKYGLVGVVTALLCILTASARVKWLNVLALIFTLLFILYLFDPFHGNNYLNVASLRQSNGNPWTWSSGVIYSIRGIWPGNQRTNDYCTQFYHGYFKIGARDFTRWTNPAVKTFGYCDRGWATALLVFQGLQLLVAAWLFVLALLLLLLRFRKSLYEEIELEIVHHDY